MCGCLSRHFPSFSGWFLFYSFRGLRRFPLPLLFPESLLFTTLSCLTFVFPLFLIILVTSALKRSRENTLVLPQLLKPHSYDVSSPRSLTHSLFLSPSLSLTASPRHRFSHSLTHCILLFLRLSFLLVTPPLPSFTKLREIFTRHKAESLKWPPGVAAVPSPPHVNSYLSPVKPRGGLYITSVVRAANRTHTHLTKHHFPAFDLTSTPKTPQKSNNWTKSRRLCSCKWMYAVK